MAQEHDCLIWWAQAELGALSEAERQSRVLTMAHAEYTLTVDQLKSFALSRMRVYMRLPLATGKQIAESYGAVMNQMPGTSAMRRVALVQTLARQFSAEGQAASKNLLPDIFRGVPSGIKAPQATATPESSAPAAEERERGWWPFGKQ